MEDAPIFPDANAEKPDKKKSKKRDGEFGALVVESPREERRQAREAERAKAKEAITPLPDTAEKPKYEERVETVAAETEPAPETQAPAEQVGEDELPVIEPELVALNRELDDQPANPAVEEFRDLIVEEGQDSDTAYEQVMAELGAEDDELAELAEEIEAEPALESGGEVEPEDTGEAEPDGAPSEEEIVFDRTVEAEPEAEPEDPAAAAAAGTAAGAATTPPPPPVPPTGRGPAGTPPPTGPAFGPPAGGPLPFSRAPAPPIANRPPRVEAIDQANPAAMALFGGIIGYLIGRRRGRIKTEKKLLPIQKKLEKQVDDLQWKLQEKEGRIRRAAARKVERDGPAALEVFAKPKPVIEAVEQPIVTERRRPAPEAHKLHGGPSSHEHIGHVLIAGAETQALARAERSSAKLAEPEKARVEKTKEAVAQVSTERHIETLNRTDLLALSEKIIVDGSSLRQIYETHLIGERGLRRLVGEHLRGGDLKKALRREVIEREIDFERDPALRDMAVSADDIKTGGSGPADSGQVALNQLIQQASGKISGANEEVAFHKARADYELQQQAAAQKQRRLVDISLTVAITLLVGVIVVIYLMRG